MEKLVRFFRDECLSHVLFARMSYVLVFYYFSVFLLDCKTFPRRYEKRGDFSIRMRAIGMCGSDG